MELLNWLNWRYAAKKMNGQTVPQDKLDYILEAARLAPTSSGLQPFQILVVSNKEILAQIRPHAMNQSQVTDCSHLLVFAAWDGYSLERIETVFDQMLAERGLPANTMDDYKKLLWGVYEPLGQAWHINHAARQAYIAASMAMVAAAEVQVDATPMEGFIPAEVDTILDLPNKGLRSVLLLPLGFRDAANDWNVNLKKFRKSKEQLIIEVK